jgi:hypothetical protein
MPEYGKYEKIPRPESIQFFIECLTSHRKISAIKREGGQVLFIKRQQGLSNLKVFMSNVYIVGLAEVHEILGQESGLNAIITLAPYNSYTFEAKEYCKENNIGLFRLKEFLGAVHYGEKKFLDYISPDDRKKENP